MSRRLKSLSFLTLSLKQLPASMKSIRLPVGLFISRDGKITDDEIHNFALISKKLDEISLAIDSLNLWVDKTASDHKINIDLLNEEKKKLQ